MQELRDFLEKVLSVKSKLKEVYYLTTNASVKSDTKRMVAGIIGIQRSIEDLLKLRATTGLARKVLKDRKAVLSLKKWSSGLPKRTKDYIDKKKKMKPEHLERYSESLQKYIDSIGEELATWTVDIEILSDLPKPPKEK
ncbi:MAG: hypothetical protein JSW61_09845 [Candidatus Thorarchaeota archaeon]|nr:MAG: hypothetical protein JSW61_09845 [Candidatus Thorarchaeota archaeon]